MSQKNSAQNIIQSYRKRQQMGPFLIGGLAVLLVVVGLLVLVIWLTGPNRPGGFALFATQTPTPTLTPTATPVTPTSTATVTPTETQTPTITMTPTPSGPFAYTVLEKDTCWDIAAKFKVDLMVLLALNNFKPNECPINVGDEINIPAPDTQLPTPTTLPTNFRGDLTYTVQMGDTIASIAYKFNSTEEAIVARNKIKDKNAINFGDQLIVPVNIATHVPTKAPTSTRGPGTAAPTTAATTAPTVAATATATQKP
jgi:LysM repeat protein